MKCWKNIFYHGIFNDRYFYSPIIEQSLGFYPTNFPGVNIPKDLKHIYSGVEAYLVYPRMRFRFASPSHSHAIS